LRLATPGLRPDTTHILYASDLLHLFSRVCGCVRVRVSERETERDREIEKERERERERERKRETEREDSLLQSL